MIFNVFFNYFKKRNFKHFELVKKMKWIFVRGIAEFSNYKSITDRGGGAVG